MANRRLRFTGVVLMADNICAGILTGTAITCFSVQADPSFSHASLRVLVTCPKTMTEETKVTGIFVALNTGD